MPSERIYLKSRQAREANAFNDPILSSTTKASYKPLDVKTLAKEERQEYQKNKGRARVAGEWWGQQIEKDATKTNYHDSYKQHNYAEWLKSVATLPVAGNKSGTGNATKNSATEKVQTPAPSEQTDPLSVWFQHRVKKPVKEDPGKAFDILTGTPLNSIASDRRANRISFDKINAKQARDRNYDIISNQIYVPVQLDEESAA
ncbi:uncharacterized protein SPPG_02527 [Spizellomyces punctatus DAOM BR117]|uniref:Uncharacterized protein n=1 Tax=Spizellomyces punctatus (strain DAOM BR117) TaxID=645134 RepID=A0A0L0HLT2_SPIPD|nr:uncharacterized protein SPPG_02527 [Spizellomyces punctatus DAOM BR117]KND02023.1 hypothetical protein SPPG_02527 [Spizellomyces punctatus DAOM BR117]|eukprot:XP_016610062.1 hypothetical protein SPPG_02527 [Spizellomyces punctatus DAOM BR117]